MSKPRAGTGFARIAVQAGNTIQKTKPKKVTLLVLGDQDVDLLAPEQSESSKHRRAEELINQGHDIRVIGESEFLELVNQS